MQYEAPLCFYPKQYSRFLLIVGFIAMLIGFPLSLIANGHLLTATDIWVDLGFAAWLAAIFFIFTHQKICIDNGVISEENNLFFGIIKQRYILANCRKVEVVAFYTFSWGIYGARSLKNYIKFSFSTGKSYSIWVNLYEKKDMNTLLEYIKSTYQQIAIDSTVEEFLKAKNLIEPSPNLETITNTQN